ncbi:hypothetical protein NIK97_12130 [Brucella pseudintermedia]|uniref:Putative tail fiber protein gp53-like C-terminal domain-containing protein n=1 Tax=Brucella pseudintermedia TaxID=370111 RepID=A0ABY5UG32_9HYPH|nr:hypothetical protein [Brucella pseudintermedia]UWL62293.1 hypothetical protein NIK97_12130 [Brucella pseudintermedia]
MAVLSDYTSGTISLANGSTTVTGTGTLFEVTRFREGDTLQIQNLTAVIASVDSDTQLTLTEPWTGTSIVDGPYRARQLADGTRVGTQAATLIELLGDGTLAGIAALGVEEGKALVGGPAGQYVLADMVTDPNGSLGKLAALTLAARQILQTDAAGDLKQIALAANKFLRTDANADIAQSDITAAAIALLNLSGTAAADRLPYLTGASGAGLTALTAFARTILDDASGAAMWETMGGAYTSGTNSSYIRLPDAQGTIVQRGVFWTGNGTDITFPIAFPTAVRSVVASIGQRAAATPTIGVMTGYEGRTAFAAYTYNTTTGAAAQATLYWTAIGW